MQHRQKSWDFFIFSKWHLCLLSQYHQSCLPSFYAWTNQRLKYWLLLSVPFQLAHDLVIEISVSPACHNKVTWLATSVQLAVVRIKPLCQTPPPWHHNGKSWWRHIQNIKSFRNVESATSSDVKSMGIYWLNFFIFLISQDENKTV